MNLEYIGAQFYSFATDGRGLAATLQTGVGNRGSAIGGRKVAFDDPLIGRYASELAHDRALRLTSVRDQFPEVAAAPPAIDLSVSSRSPFSLIAHGAGLVPASVIFDPFVGSNEFLLGAFVMEYLVSAAYRSFISGAGSDITQQSVTQSLANAIYHGGLIRAAVSERSVQNPQLTDACVSMGRYITYLGQRRKDNNSSDEHSAEAVGAKGDSIPYISTPEQIMKMLYLSADSGSPGGFLPLGANGLIDRA